jgi:hypothetical protein
MRRRRWRPKGRGLPCAAGAALRAATMVRAANLTMGAAAAPQTSQWRRGCAANLTMAPPLRRKPHSDGAAAPQTSQGRRACAADLTMAPRLRREPHNGAAPDAGCALCSAIAANSHNRACRRRAVVRGARVERPYLTTDRTQAAVVQFTASAGSAGRHRSQFAAVAVPRQDRCAPQVSQSRRTLWPLCALQRHIGHIAQRASSTGDRYALCPPVAGVSHNGVIARRDCAFCDARFARDAQMRHAPRYASARASACAS